MLFIVACGPSEQEIQAQIDEAVETAVEEVLEEITTTSSTTTTTTSSTTTTTSSTTTTTTTTIPYAKETGVGLMMTVFQFHQS